MRNFKYTLWGFVFFLLSISFIVGIGIVSYSYVLDKSTSYVAFIIFLVIILASFICSIIDYIRRKITIERPLKEILFATKQMARGNFNVKLTPKHSYRYYDEFDIIKDDLNKMALELSKSEILKTDFISNLSHEIKTPLAIILNYSKVLENKNLTDEEKNKYLKSLQKACHSLNNLVNNILKLNKLENQKLIPEISRFNLSELLSSQILQFEEIIEKRNITLNCNIEDDLYINSEASYIEIIINNLMSNAIKFSDKNSTIYVSLIKINNIYIMKFKDEGCGMDPETGKRIFDKFYQGDTSHHKEGNGLGLALVKKVIDIIGGTINVESELNVGSTFTIEIKEM